MPRKLMGNPSGVGNSITTLLLGGTSATTAPNALMNLNGVSILDKTLVIKANGILALDSRGRIPSSVLSPNLKPVVQVIGPVEVYANSKTEYKITNYDCFTEYQLSPILNGVSIFRSRSVEYTAPSTPGTYGFIINGTVKSIKVVADPNAGTGSTGGTGGTPPPPPLPAVISQPIITYPSNNQSGLGLNFTFTTQGMNVRNGTDTFASATWEISRDPTFNNTNFALYGTQQFIGAYETSYAISGLSLSTTYYLRLSYTGSRLAATDMTQATVIKFTTTGASINKPVITQPVHNSTGVSKNLTVDSSYFATSVADVDTLSAAVFTIYTNQAKTNIASGPVTMYAGSETSWNPSGLLDGTEYFLEVTHTGTAITNTVASNLIKFTTAPAPVTPPPPPPPKPTGVGAQFGGGYYAGKIKSDIDGKIYYLIVAPQHDSYLSRFCDKNNLGVWKQAKSMSDGRYNCDQFSGTAFGPVQFCENLDIGGYDDWYLPSRDELELMMSVFKPSINNPWPCANWRTDAGFRAGYGGINAYGTDSGSNGENFNSVPPKAGYSVLYPKQTTIASYKWTNAVIKGVDALEINAWYWSSSECCNQGPTGHTSVWIQHTTNGQQHHFWKFYGNNWAYVRAVRRVEVV